MFKNLAFYRVIQSYVRLIYVLSTAIIEFWNMFTHNITKAFFESDNLKLHQINKKVREYAGKVVRNKKFHSGAYYFNYNEDIRSIHVKIITVLHDYNVCEMSNFWMETSITHFQHKILPTAKIV